MATSLKITILGCYSATPRTFNNPTSQVVELNNQVFLVDCGEGTQVALRKSKIKFSRIKRVFISHLHGDHFFGLIGLISTFGMLKRDLPLHIYGPKGIKEVTLLQIKYAQSFTHFDLIFHELEMLDSQILFEDEHVKVQNIPLKHRIYTNGFLFTAKESNRKLNLNALQNYDVNPVYYSKIKKGFDHTLDNGEVLPNSELTLDPDPPKSYAYCSDTVFKPDIIPIINKVTALYHESTFQEAHKHLTAKTGHSTAIEAATIARDAEVLNLILGHYSTRYNGLEGFKMEAQTVFKSTHLAEDGKTFSF